MGEMLIEAEFPTQLKAHYPTMRTLGTYTRRCSFECSGLVLNRCCLRPLRQEAFRTIILLILFIFSAHASILNSHYS